MSLLECQILKLSRSLEDKSSDAASGRAMGCSREVNRQVVGKPVAPAHWWRGSILGTATRVWRTRNQLPGTVSLSGGCYSSPVSWHPPPLRPTTIFFLLLYSVVPHSRWAWKTEASLLLVLITVEADSKKRGDFRHSSELFCS